MKSILTAFLPRLVVASCAVGMGVAAWVEVRALPEDQPKELPLLGTGTYGTSQVETISQHLQNTVPKTASLAIWGGAKADGHGFPFRYRITADWFLLPNKPTSIVSSNTDAATYDYIFSPWRLGNRLNTDTHTAELIADENWIWLYRIVPTPSPTE